MSLVTRALSSDTVEAIEATRSQLTHSRAPRQHRPRHVQSVEEILAELDMEAKAKEIKPGEAPVPQPSTRLFWCVFDFYL